MNGYLPLRRGQDWFVFAPWAGIETQTTASAMAFADELAEGLHATGATIPNFEIAGADGKFELTAEGVAKTKQVARGVTELGATADLLLSSPYVRAMQTAEIFAGALGYAKAKIRRTDLLLPGADAGLLFRELAKDKDSAEVTCAVSI